MLGSDEQRIVLIPYWLQIEPEKLYKSDHSWWFESLQKNDILIYAGPYIRNEGASKGNNNWHIKIKTPGLSYSISEIQNKLKSFNIKVSDITLMWHIIEASATCRVEELLLLPNAIKIAVVADTHHLKNPISSLISLIKRESYDLVCCTHNQHEPFFAASCGLPTISFPYINPYENQKANQINPKDNAIKYYGNIISQTHYFRSIFINESLRSIDVTLMPRMKMKDWTSALMNNRSIVLTCSLNGSFSFQTLFPILAGNFLLTDPISKSSWIHGLIHDSSSCFTYRSMDELRYLAKYTYDILNRDSTKAEKVTTKSAIDFSSKLMSQSELLNAYRCVEANLGNLQNLSNEHSEHLKTTLNKIKVLEGEETLCRLINIFENLQELHRRYWSIVIISNAKERSETKENLTDDFILQIPNVLPRSKILSKREFDRQKIEKSKRFETYSFEIDTLLKKS